MKFMVLFLCMNFVPDSYAVTIPISHTIVLCEPAIIYANLPTEEEIEELSDEAEKISLSHPELVWGPIEDNPCDSK